ncbi:MAG: patatin-like phospholipase family protein [Planctomycetota bacterium]
MATAKHRLIRTTWRLRPPVLALGGGGARGFAHLGVLQALDEAGLSVRAIAGTSMGAVVGGMYLAYGSAARATDLWREALSQDLIPSVRPIGRVPDADAKEHPLIQVARRIRNRVVISFAMNKGTVLDDTALVEALEFLIPDLQFSDLPKPLVVVATNLETGAEMRLRSGPIRPAMVATSAIPGMVPAVEIDGQPMVDGGVVAEVPVVAAREEGWPVIAVDVSLDVPPLKGDDLVLDTMMRTQMMTARLLRVRQLRSATRVIRPGVGDARWAEWNRFDEFIEAGRKATLEFLGL